MQSIIGYSLIAKDPSLTKAERDVCAVEIEQQFYVLLNCIYNIKEKLERLFFISKNNPILENSILTDSAKKEILKLFKETYPLIEKFCVARGRIVHDIYSISYNTEKNCISVSYSIFDLSESNILEKKSSRITFDICELIDIIETLQELRKRVILILSDTENIDLEKLRNKFHDKAKESYIVSL